VPGIDIVGPFPNEVQNFSFFSAAVMKDSPAAREFMALLRSAPVREAMRNNLFQP
jgi:hypothetical protein